MKKFKSYEELVIESLVKEFRYSEIEARFMVRGYYSIMERIGFFENPTMWASKIDEAMNSNITPDMWHAVL